MSVVLFQLMMHQGKTEALPPLHASTLAESLRSQTQNAACHVGALEVHRMTRNPLHLATRSQPINSQSKGDQGQGSPGWSSIPANSWGLFRWIMRAPHGVASLPCWQCDTIYSGQVALCLLWPGLYWAGMRANAPYLCRQGSHCFDWRACSSYSHTESSLQRQQQGDPVKVLKSFTREAAWLVIKGHLPFPLPSGPSRSFVLIPRSLLHYPK